MVKTAQNKLFRLLRKAGHLLVCSSPQKRQHPSQNMRHRIWLQSSVFTHYLPFPHTRTSHHHSRWTPSRATRACAGSYLSHQVSLLPHGCDCLVTEHDKTFTCSKATQNNLLKTPNSVRSHNAESTSIQSQALPRQ